MLSPFLLAEIQKVSTARLLFLWTHKTYLLPNPHPRAPGRGSTWLVSRASINRERSSWLRSLKTKRGWIAHEKAPSRGAVTVGKIMTNSWKNRDKRLHQWVKESPMFRPRWSQKWTTKLQNTEMSPARWWTQQLKNGDWSRKSQSQPQVARHFMFFFCNAVSSTKISVHPCGAANSD